MEAAVGEGWLAAWQLAAELAIDRLRAADLEERCRRSGATLRPGDGAIELPFLDQVCCIHPPDFDVTVGGEVPSPVDRVLVLRYLTAAPGIPPSGEWMAFNEVPGGEMYLPNFRGRSARRLERAFGAQPEALVAAGRSLGGSAAEHGDASIAVPVFPGVPVLAVLWRGDEEFPASANLLFDRTAPEYLSIEDMVVVAGRVAGRLCDGAATTGDSST